jgi:serine/threonine protein kinase/tetratricopeptide (TPR) repeat protein
MPEHQLQVDEVFDEAIRRAAGPDRAHYLDEACGGDLELRLRVERLLRAVSEAGSFLEAPAQDPSPTADQLLVESPGTVIGPFKLIEQIGEGGMGTVWMAQQTAPVKRVVALKLIKAGMDSKQVIARFEAERQALALMDHANIARVVDAGTTSAGRPYFVMDLVKGVPITEYCDEHHLTPRLRLELFIAVCQAVQHAHQKGIIHRDLKPSNVLVALYDGKPVPKVIDFGVAKAAGQQLTDKTLLTGFGAIIGTLEYMSPEQAEINQLDIDTRSDIYSLGVLLYELLTGTTPLGRNRVKESGVLEALRIIREEEAPTLSNRLASTEELPAIAANRGLEPAKLTRLVRGELDWIVMKALEKDRNRRYETPNAIAMDLQRYLADEPVQACPRSAWYRLRKFVRRNKGPVLASAALALSLLAGVGAVTAMQAKADRERATREAWTSASVAAATREARERADEAWSVSAYPDRMQRATDAAVAAVRRAEDFAAGGSLAEPARAELAPTRQAVDDLIRHTRLITTIADHSLKTTDDYALGGVRAEVNLCSRSREALREFGLDPINGPIDDVAQEVANSRIRDALLGTLLEWHNAAAPLAKSKRKKVYSKRLDPDGPEVLVVEFALTSDYVPADVVAVYDRLGLVIRAARQQCGGPYAQWQELQDRKDVAGLVAFAATPEALSFRSSLVNVLGRDLIQAKEYQAARDYLRAAVDRYPLDVLLHMSLAGVCSQAQPGPAGNAEGHRHMVAATALRPDSAYFHDWFGHYYAGLRMWDQAAAAYRKAIALNPGSPWHHQKLALALDKLNDKEGVIAAWREAARLKPDDLGFQDVLRTVLAEVGRHAEAAEVLAAIRRNPAWVDDRRANVRYIAACDAIRSVYGRVANPAPPDEHAELRKQALALLTAELEAMKPRADTNRTQVYWLMQSMLTDSLLGWVREPTGPSAPKHMVAAWNQIPSEERDAWIKLWADIRELRDRTAPPKDGK